LTHTVRAITANEVHLEDVSGIVLVIPRPQLFEDPGLEVVAADRPGPAPLPPAGMLDDVPPEALEQARWWETHLVEVLTGQCPKAGAGKIAKPQYDLQRYSLRQRELAKVDELRAAGHQVSFTTVKRLRRNYELRGLWGLIDQRKVRPVESTGRVDERVLQATRQAINDETNRSTGTVVRLRRAVVRILAEEYGPDVVPMPAQATFYRLVKRLSHGRHTFGSARTRRSVAKPPNGPFGTVTAVRPGEWVHVDSTTLDVRVVLDNGIVDRVELTWMIDLATRTIGAAVLSPTTKAVDAALLLAHCLTPEPMRPGWADALRMSRSVLPHRRLAELDVRLEHAAARPVIVPETIVSDNGMVYMSQTFRTACRAMGINIQPSHKGSPWENGVVERSFDSVDTLFAQYVAGYVGNSVENRGKNAEQKAAWSMLELQELLDEWVVAAWQNRSHEGLRHPVTPGKAMTPNEKYAALVETSGYVPVPLSHDDYIELLPVTWRSITPSGIKIKHRRYDCRALNPYRRQHSGIETKNGRWEVHHDPYDVTRIWVRNHHDGGWITVPWTHLKSTPMPFGELAWEHARSLLARRGSDPATEQEIAQAVNDLLDRAGQEPQRPPDSARSDRTAGRTRATALRAQAQPEPSAAPVADTEEYEETDDDESAAPVIPLPIFDARKEAEKWRY
jgi:transposase InsO family protein